MATVTGMTAEKMQELADAFVVSGEIDEFGDLILTTAGGDDINAGAVLGTVPDASDTVKGIVELATNAEATTGTDTTRAVTPAGLAAAVGSLVPDASTTVKGKVELATDGETTTGTDTTRAITPSNLAAAAGTFVPAASTTVQGKVELATDAETITGTDTARAITPASLVAALMSRIYPVGSIYMSVDNTNPGTFFGGTWVAWGEGRVPVGRHATSGTFNVAAETTGGAETHALSIAELASHTHTGTTGNEGTQASFPLSYNGGSGTASSGTGTNTRYGSGNAHTHTFTTNATGSGTAHNNLQPYIVCYMWKRTV